MCGIVGFSNHKLSYNESLSIIKKMLLPLNHRGPDDEGIKHNSSLTFGHRRLSIIDPHGGKQPCSDDHGNVLIFNGEIYGYQKLAKQLREEGVNLRNNSDTEVLFWLLKNKGLRQALDLINGMFAFSFYSQRDKKLYLVRDRFGEKPLFYCYKKHQIAFASEIKSLRQHPVAQQSSLDPEQLSNFLTLEYLPGTMSGYESIKKLLPGHWLCFDLETKAVDIQRYNKIQIATDEVHQNEQEKLERLKSYLSESVKQRLIADVPVGVFLSGGLDSSIIAAIARQHSDSINSYTIKMPGSSFDESPYAEACAKTLDLHHTTIELSGADVLKGIDLIVEKLDEPLADSSLIPSSLLCQYSSQHVKVAIGGDGADELFAGYPNFKAQKFAMAMSMIPKRLGEIFRYSLRCLPVSNEYMNLAFRLTQLSYGFGMPVEQQSMHWMSALSVNDQKQLWTSKYQNYINKKTYELLKKLKKESGCKKEIDQLLYIFTNTYLPDNILVKMDRASMYSSLEVRSPFLDKNFSEYVFSLPQRDKLRGFQGKYLLKNLAASYLPKEIIYRKKHGFGFPISKYIRTQLKERIADTILDKTNPISGMFNTLEIERYWIEHQNLQHDHGKKLWALFVLMNVARN